MSPSPKPSTPIRKVLISSVGDHSVVSVIDSTIEAPTSKQIQCRVLYASFATTDIVMRLGRYPLQKTAPLTPGYCFVGRVETLGSNTTSTFRRGDLVASCTVYDSQATLINVDEKYLIPVPEVLATSGQLASATPMIVDWNTAYGLVHRAGRIVKGDTVFIHGLSGAVGNAAMQLSLLQGATVYGTASARNTEELMSQGATKVFDYRSKGWIEEIKSLPSGGVNAVFDPLGFESWDESWSILSSEKGVLVGYGGNAATFSKISSSSTTDTNTESKPTALGTNNQESSAAAQHHKQSDGKRDGFMSGGTMSVVWPTVKLLSKNLSLCGKKRTVFHYIDKTSKHFAPETLALFDLLVDGHRQTQPKIDVKIKKICTLDEVPDMHRDWNGMKGIGSGVVQIGS